MSVIQYWSRMSWMVENQGGGFEGHIEVLPIRGAGTLVFEGRFRVCHSADKSSPTCRRPAPVKRGVRVEEASGTCGRRPAELRQTAWDACNGPSALGSRGSGLNPLELSILSLYGHVSLPLAKLPVVWFQARLLAQSGTSFRHACR